MRHGDGRQARRFDAIGHGPAPSNARIAHARRGAWLAPNGATPDHLCTAHLTATRSNEISPLQLVNRSREKQGQRLAAPAVDPAEVPGRCFGRLLPCADLRCQLWAEARPRCRFEGPSLNRSGYSGNAENPLCHQMDRFPAHIPMWLALCIERARRLEARIFRYDGRFLRASIPLAVISHFGFNPLLSRHRGIRVAQGYFLKF